MQHPFTTIYNMVPPTVPLAPPMLWYPQYPPAPFVAPNPYFMYPLVPAPPFPFSVAPLPPKLQQQSTTPVAPLIEVANEELGLVSPVEHDSTSSLVLVDDFDDKDTEPRKEEEEKNQNNEKKNTTTKKKKKTEGDRNYELVIDASVYDQFRVSAIKKKNWNKKKQLWECHLCDDYKTSLSCNLRDHLFKHLDLKPYKCKSCSYSCTFQSAIIRHQSTHDSDLPFACPLCSTTLPPGLYVGASEANVLIVKVYATRQGYNLKRHLQLKHRMSHEDAGAAFNDKYPDQKKQKKNEQ